MRTKTPMWVPPHLSERLKTSSEEHWQERGENEHLCPLGGNAHWFSHPRKHYGRFSRKLEIELFYDLVLAVLGISPENTKTLIRMDTHTPVYAVFTEAR